MGKTKILVVDDDPNILQLINLYLTREGFEVVTAEAGDEALRKFKSDPPNMMLLDVMLPGMDGYEVVHELRRHKKATPVLMLTARDEVSSKVRGLDSGADDYMTKPFAPEELLARVRALSRRQGDVVLDEMRYMDLMLDLSACDARCGAKSVHLGYKEFSVLKLLMAAAGSVVTKEELIVRVWGAESGAEDNNVEAYISFLRKKLSYLGSCVGIGTLRKVGYRLEVGA